MTDDTYQPNAVEPATELTIAWLSNPNTRLAGRQLEGNLLLLD